MSSPCETGASKGSFSLIQASAPADPAEVEVMLPLLHAGWARASLGLQHVNLNPNAFPTQPQCRPHPAGLAERIHRSSASHLTAGRRAAQNPQAPVRNTFSDIGTDIPVTITSSETSSTWETFVLQSGVGPATKTIPLFKKKMFPCQQPKKKKSVCIQRKEPWEMPFPMHDGRAAGALAGQRRRTAQWQRARAVVCCGSTRAAVAPAA